MRPPIRRPARHRPARPPAGRSRPGSPGPSRRRPPRRPWPAGSRCYLTARHARQAKARSRQRARRRRAAPATSCQVAGSSPAASIRSADLHEQPPEIGRDLDRARAGAGAAAAPAGSSSPPGSPAPRPSYDGGDDDLGEHLGDRRGHAGGHLAVARDDAAERRHRIGREAPCAYASAIDAPTAMPQGLACLMIATAGSAWSHGRPPRRVGIDVVVVRHLLALQLLGPASPARRSAGRLVERRPLVRVLAVAQDVRARSPGAPTQDGNAGPVGSRRARTLPSHDATAMSYVGGVRERLRRQCDPRARASNPPAAAARPPRRTARATTTTATLAWFLAAARTIAGPPMSICSTHSSGPHRRPRSPERVQVHHDAGRTARCRGPRAARGARAAAGRPAARRAPAGAASSPARRGTPGSPSRRSPAVTGTPAAAIVAAVDPVETISTPAACRPCASSSRPVLSYTLTSARCGSFTGS